MVSGGEAEAEIPRVARPVPLRESVYDTLLDLIVNRTLRPGAHLVESELAGRLGVSRQPVREALQRLNTEGWVELRPGHGAYVHIPTEDEADQLLAVRSLLETEAARLAARHATEETIAHLRKLRQRGVDALDADDVDAMVAANADLHAAITDLSGNAPLAELTRQVDRRVRWYYAPVARHRGHRSWTEHAKIIDAIAAHDSAKAASLMRKHTETTRETYHQMGEEKPEG
ncbi:MAG TPA: GntR family transcriptional regulator [Streptosporangiaceae bacterium]|jgi:DNA-binding GntR family transcriptional regulator